MKENESLDNLLNQIGNSVQNSSNKSEKKKTKEKIIDTGDNNKVKNFPKNKIDNKGNNNFSALLNRLFIFCVKKFSEIGHFIKTFCIKYSDYLISIFVSLISLFFFTSIGYYEFFSRNEFLNLRVYGVLSSVLIIISTYLVSFLSKWSFWKSVLVWIQSNILIFFSFVYFLTINNRNFYPPAITVLTLLIFLNTKYIFSKKTTFNLYLLFSKVFTFSLAIFAYLDFLASNRVSNIEFNQQLLALFFNLDTNIWIAIISLSISLFSVYSFNFQSWKKFSLYFILFFILHFELFKFVNWTVLNNFFYWDKAMIIAIVWNFLFTRIKTIATEEVDPNFWHKTYISTGYHIFLILLVLSFSLFI
jgi:hypothetical protein